MSTKNNLVLSFSTLYFKPYPVGLERIEGCVEFPQRGKPLNPSAKNKKGNSPRLKEELF